MAQSKFSVDRRRGKFCTICMSKILQKLEQLFYYEYMNDRSGLLHMLVSLMRAAARRLGTIRDGTLEIRCPKLFDCLPEELCGLGAYTRRAAPNGGSTLLTNSITAQVRRVRNRRGPLKASFLVGANHGPLKRLFKLL